MEYGKIELTPELQEIFDNIIRDSKFTGRDLQSKHNLADYYLQFPEYQDFRKKLQEDTRKAEEQVREIRKNNPNLSDEEFFKVFLTNYAQNIIETIKKEYQGILPEETVNRLNKFNLAIVNDPRGHGGMYARPELCQVVIDIAHHALDRNDLEGKIVRAMGSMTHELFHIIYRMFKEKDDMDEKMVYDLASGDKAIAFGRVGHMINEGLAEKKSIEFCERNHIYHTLNPSYIQFTKLCDYIQRVSGIDEKFLMENNYEAVLNLFTPEVKEVYQSIERFEYREKFPLDLKSGGQRKIAEDEVLSSHNEKNNVPYINPNIYRQEDVGIDAKIDKPPFYKRLTADKVINVTGEGGSGKSTFVEKYKNNDDYIVVDYDLIFLNPQVDSVEYELKKMLLEKRGKSLFESIRDVGIDQVRNNFTTMYKDVLSYLTPLDKTIVLDGSQLRFINDVKAIKGEFVALRPSLQTCISRSLNRFITNNPNATLEDKERYVEKRTNALTSLNPMLNDLLNKVNNLPSVEHTEDYSLAKNEENKNLDKGPKLTRTKPNNTENGGHISVIGLSLFILLAEIITCAFVYLLIKK